jgi:hypothetical protein
LIPVWCKALERDDDVLGPRSLALNDILGLCGIYIDPVTRQICLNLSCPDEVKHVSEPGLIHNPVARKVAQQTGKRVNRASSGIYSATEEVDNGYDTEADLDENDFQELRKIVIPKNDDEKNEVFQIDWDETCVVCGDDDNALVQKSTTETTGGSSSSDGPIKKVGKS